ncbi:hypothetical protein NB717_003784 [Xanthomonas sacchari]|nr:hypothetical protein [Xanthomonas sacchari]
MAAGLRPLRDHRIGTGGLRGQRLVQGGGAGEPGDPGLLQALHLVRPEQAHDRRGHCRPRREQGLELGIEIGGRRIAGGGVDRRSPGREKGAHLGLGGGIARGGRIRHPQVDLCRPAAGGAERIHPRHDVLRRRQHRAHRPHAASRGDRGRQRHRAGTRHRAEQDRQAQAEALAERGGASLKRRLHCPLTVRGRRQYAGHSLPLPPEGTSTKATSPSRWAARPAQIPWATVYAMACLAGIANVFPQPG